MLRLPSPKTLLSAAPVDPFVSAARPIALFEHYLLDHCTYRLLPPFQDDCSDGALRFVG
jgi:hypothetical protein